jgi:hypothetical protein
VITNKDKSEEICSTKSPYLYVVVDCVSSLRLHMLLLGDRCKDRFMEMAKVFYLSCSEVAKY